MAHYLKCFSRRCFWETVQILFFLPEDVSYVLFKEKKNPCSLLVYISFYRVLGPLVLLFWSCFLSIPLFSVSWTKGFYWELLLFPLSHYHNSFQIMGPHFKNFLMQFLKLLSIYSYYKILAIFPMLSNTPLSLSYTQQFVPPTPHPYIAPPNW